MAHSRNKNLSKNFLIAGIIVIVLITISFFIFKPNRNKFPDSIGVFINGSGYYLEVAQTSIQREKGLSERNDLCFNCGMLFVFNKQGIYPFWMKNTHIPLDIIWLDSNYKIVKIVTAIKTDSEDQYSNDQPAKYAIELRANEAFKLDLKVGDTISLPDLDDQ